MRLVVLFISVSCLFGCGKKAIEIDSNYAGAWLTCSYETNGCNDICDSYYVLRIHSSGNGEYTQEGIGDAYSMLSEGKVRIKNNTLKIGLKKKFNIDLPPTKPDSTICWLHYDYNWIMVLDGDTFYDFK